MAILIIAMCIVHEPSKSLYVNESNSIIQHLNSSNSRYLGIVAKHFERSQLIDC